MSEAGPHDQPEETSARWVNAKVVGDEPEPPPRMEEAAAPVPVPDQPPVTEEEITGARWFAIAFLVIVIPLGLVFLALMFVALVRSVD